MLQPDQDEDQMDNGLQHKDLGDHRIPMDDEMQDEDDGVMDGEQEDGGYHHDIEEENEAEVHD